MLKMPKNRMPAAINNTTRSFGDCLGIDLFSLPDYKGNRWTYLNVVDHATRFQVCWPIPSKHPAVVRDALERIWLCWAGPPKAVTVDQGGEFGREFSDYLEGLGVHVRWTAAEAPWKNAAAERHGGYWKAVATHAIYEGEAVLAAGNANTRGHHQLER